MFEIFIFLYIAVTAFAAIMTYSERKRAGSRSLLFSSLSVVACVVWPATIAVILISVKLRTT